MSLLFIIDGYNLVHHPLFAKLTNKNAAEPSEALINFLKFKKPQGSKNKKVIVVFDGYPHTQVANDTGSHCINVIYSRQISADDKIRLLVEGAAGVRSMVVVSDDKQVRSMARGAGAVAMFIEDFIPQEKKVPDSLDDAVKEPLSYSQQARINRELRKIWLG